MTKNEDQVVVMLNAFAVAFTDRKLAKEGIGMYCEMLKDIPVDVLKNATGDLIASKKFFPTVAEIREKCKGFVREIAGVKSPAEAWEEMAHLMRAVGSYEKPEWSTTLIERTMYACGGWYHCCVEADMEILRAQFMRIYESLAEREDELLLRLPETDQYIREEKRKLEQSRADKRRRLLEDQRALIHHDPQKFADMVDAVQNKFSIGGRP